MLGRFISADPFIQHPQSTQGLNRYTYTNNNPLSFTDPSGFFFGKIAGFFKKALKNPIVVAVATVALTFAAIYIIGPAVVGLIGQTATNIATSLIASAANVAAALVNGKSLANVALTTTASMALNSAIDTFLPASPGSFSSSFQRRTSILPAQSPPDLGRFILRNVVRMMANGFVSVLGGGKFLNGANSRSFAYAMNQELVSQFPDPRVMHEDEARKVPMACGQAKCSALELFGAFWDGAASVPRGTYYAGRFIARGTGVLGSEEQERWRLEGKVVNFAFDQYVSNDIIRAEVNQSALNIIQAINRNATDGYLKWHTVGRVSASVLLPPFGGLAAIGDFTRAIEHGHDVIDSAISGGLLGNPEPRP